MAGCSPYSHSSDANPIIPLMKSGCAANEITLQQAARLHSAAALSIGPAVLVGSLRREPPRATPAARAPGPCHSGPRPASRQKGAESRMALNKTPALGFQVPDFPVPCQHGGCSPRVLGGDTASAEPSSGDGLPRPCGTDARGGAGVCSTRGDCAASFGIMLLMSISHKLAEKHPSTLALASLGLIPKCFLSICQNKQGHPFP